MELSPNAESDVFEQTNALRALGGCHHGDRRTLNQRYSSWHAQDFGSESGLLIMRLCFRQPPWIGTLALIENAAPIELLAMALGVVPH